MKKLFRKRWLNELKWYSLYVATAIILALAIQYQSNSRLQNVSVDLGLDEGEMGLIGEEDVLRYLNRILDKDITLYKLEDANVKKMESALNSSNFIRKAEVFIDAKKQVFIKCDLSRPIVRIDRKEGRDFYLDEYGNIIPLSKKATLRVPVASGHLGTLKKDYLTDESSIYRKVFETAKKIDKDPFLKSLIEQMYVEENQELVMVPKLGRQKILFGAFERVDDKMENLKVFYKSGISSTGWDRFKYLDLQWKNQVVKIN